MRRGRQEDWPAINEVFFKEFNVSEEIKCTGCGGEFERKDVAFVPEYAKDGSIPRSVPFCWQCLMKWRGISYRDGKPEATEWQR